MPLYHFTNRMQYAIILTDCEMCDTSRFTVSSHFLIFSLSPQKAPLRVLFGIYTGELNYQVQHFKEIKEVIQSPKW